MIGLVLSAAMYPLAPGIVGLLSIPAGLEGEATMVLRLVPALASLAIMGESTSAILVGHGRFKTLAVALWSSAGVFAVAVVVLVEPGAHLGALMLATALRFVVQIVASLALAARNISIRWPFLPSMATAREVGGYSSRMQLSAITGFVNEEMDALVIAALLPVKYVGLFQIGQQVASAVRSIPLYAFAPLLTRLTTIFRVEGRERPRPTSSLWSAAGYPRCSATGSSRLRRSASRSRFGSGTAIT